MRRSMILVWILAFSLVSANAFAQQVFFGNLHSHTSYSDGTGTPDDAFQHARQTARLDFLAITEHNHSKAESGAGEREDGILIATDPALYTGPAANALIPAATRWSEDGKFVALYGQEFSTISSGNHVNVFDVPKVIDSPNGDFKELLDWMNANRDSSGSVALLQFNHPGLFDNPAIEYGRDDFPSIAAWIAALDPHVKLIEVLNGPAMTKVNGLRSSEVQEEDYFTYLNLGFHVAPSAGQDNHYRTWGTATDARVAVVAERLTKADILAALKARHAYATEDKNLRVIFKVNDALMGDRISPPAVGGVLDIRVSIKDDDEPDASYKIEVYSDVPGGQPASPGNPVDVFQVNGDTAGFMKLDGIRYREPGQYVFLKITQTSEHGEADRVWTAPVWLEGPGAVTPPAPVQGGGLRIVRLLPDPEGSDEENESITLRNTGNASMSLAGWSLRDLSGKTWSLDGVGTIAAGDEREVKRNGQPMSLNNDGDTIELLDPQQRRIQTVRYGAVSRGEVVTTRR
jgi:lamin tail-like protein